MNNTMESGQTLQSQQKAINVVQGSQLGHSCLFLSKNFCLFSSGSSGGVSLYFRLLLVVGSAELSLFTLPSVSMVMVWPTGGVALKLVLVSPEAGRTVLRACCSISGVAGIVMKGALN